MAERQAVQLEKQSMILDHVVQTLSLQPHPPSALAPSFASPRTTRNQGQGHQQANTHSHQSLSVSHPVTVNRGGSSSSSNGTMWLQPSNANGRDSTGYTVGRRRQLKEFISSVTSVPLGILNKEHTQVDWISGNWTPTTTDSASDKLAGTQNTEAKKVMELVVHLATDAELSSIFNPLPQLSAALATAMNEKRQATDGVILKVMNFLELHEKKTKASGRKVTYASTTGALSKRWGVLKYIKADPNHVDPGIQSWSNAGTAMSGSAMATGADSSSSLPKSKRSRSDQS